MCKKSELESMLRCVSGPSAIGQGKRRFEVGHGVKEVGRLGGREVAGAGTGLRDNLFIQIKSDPGTAECSPLLIRLVVTQMHILTIYI